MITNAPYLINNLKKTIITYANGIVRDLEIADITIEEGSVVLVIAGGRTVIIPGTSIKEIEIRPGDDV